MGEPQIQAALLLSMPRLMFIAPVQAKSLKLSLHALLLARIRLAGGKEKGKEKKKHWPKNHRIVHN